MFWTKGGKKKMAKKGEKKSNGKCEQVRELLLKNWDTDKICEKTGAAKGTVNVQRSKLVKDGQLAKKE